MKNKTGALVRLICFSLLALILTGIMIAGIKNEDFSFNLNFGLFSSNSYKNADKYTAGNIEITPTKEGLQELNISWIEGDVTVIPYNGNTISVYETADGTISKADSVHTYYHDGILDIQYCESKSWTLGFSDRATNKQLKLQIPSDLCNKIKTLNGDFVSANANFTDIKVSSLTFDSVSGDVNYHGEANEIKRDSVSGNASITTLNIPSKISTDTVSGDITLFLPADAEFEAELDSVSGDMDCNFDTSSSSFKDNSGSIVCGNGSDGEYEFDSVSGDVTIKSNN